MPSCVRCPSVTFVYCVETSKCIIAVQFLRTKPYGKQILTETSLTEALNACGIKKSRVLTNVSLYLGLGNDTK